MHQNVTCLQGTAHSLWRDTAHSLHNFFFAHCCRLSTRKDRLKSTTCATMPVSGSLLQDVGFLQDGARGQVIKTWADAAQEADALGAPMIRTSIVGRPFTVLMLDPTAINAILKKPMYVPKMRQLYSLFYWLVRSFGKDLLGAC